SVWSSAVFCGKSKIPPLNYLLDSLGVLPRTRGDTYESCLIWILFLVRNSQNCAGPLERKAGMCGSGKRCMMRFVSPFRTRVATWPLLIGDVWCSNPTNSNH